LVPASSDDFVVRVLRARVQIEDKQYAAAARTLEMATQGPDNRYNYRYWLALAERDQGQVAKARATLDQLLVAQPDHQLGLEAKVHLASDQKDWQTALNAQTRLSALRPDSANEQCRLGDLFLRAKNLDKAEQPFEKGLRLDSYAFLCRRDLGELYRATGRPVEAIRELEWVVQYFPEGDAKTYISLSLAYEAVHKRTAAESTLEKGKRLFPADQLLQKFSLKNN
jgi:predicted Zn-dependent protease